MQMLKLPLPIALCLLAACSRGASTAQSGAAANPAPTAAAQTPETAGGGTPGNPCDVITAADMAGILTAPATRNAGPDPTSSVYRTQTKANVTLSVANGDAAKGAWTLATTYSGTTAPLAGVGDEALHNPNGTTLIARKGDLSCRVDVVGYDNSAAMDDITKDRGDALASKLGALCKKIFASH